MAALTVGPAWTALFFTVLPLLIFLDPFLIEHQHFRRPVETIRGLQDDWACLPSAKGDRTRLRNSCGPGAIDGLWEQDYLFELFNITTHCQHCNSHSVVLWHTHHEHLRERFPIPEGGNLPPVLFHTSDEACIYPEAFPLYHRFKLVLRQYACPDRYANLWAKHPNVRIIPVGYVSGVVPRGGSREVAEGTLRTLDAEEDRRYGWAFVGAVRGNRVTGIKTLSTIRPNFVTKKRWLRKPDHVPKSEVTGIYREANFVMSGRGHVNLDCYRHYEASMSGAIPVIQAEDEHEVQAWFSRFHDFPRDWLFVTTWQEGADRMKGLLDNPRELRARQRRVVQWFLDEIESIQAEIREVLDEQKQ